MDIQTLIIEKCSPCQLNDLPNNLENLMILELIIKDGNSVISNMPITLKTLVIFTIDYMGITNLSLEDCYNNFKLPFGCKFIKPENTMNTRTRTRFMFNYLNDSHEFLVDTYILKNDKYLPYIIYKESCYSVNNSTKEEKIYNYCIYI